MVRLRHNLDSSVAKLLAAALLCLSPSAFASGGDAVVQLPGNSLGASSGPVVMPLSRPSSAAGLAFDLGGSEKRKLELQLSKPLTLDIANSRYRSSSGVGSVFLDSALNLHLYDNLDITTSLGAGKSQAAFQPLGSIHCQNGVLERGSYRASDCHFINQVNVLKQDQVAMSLRYGNNGIKTAVSMFRNETRYREPVAVNRPLPAVLPGAGLLASLDGNALFPTVSPLQSLEQMDGHSMGLGMEFQVGFTTDSAGDLQLGLQLTRVLDASYSYQADAGFAPDFQNWTIANPFDSAKVNLDWSKGSFSGGIQGYYRDQIQFLNREALDSSTTFDVHFTWRAPWNANLSVGTSNVLNAGVEDKGKKDSKDPFEAVYGRIPYVRYEQDL